MKERLTKRDKDGNAVAFNYIKTAGEFKEVVDRLAEYEDLEEQGLIVRLPCKVGDKVYYIYQNFFSDYLIEEKTVLGYDCDNDGMGWQLRLDIGYIPVSFIRDIIFLTRAEAEKKLEELNK